MKGFGARREKSAEAVELHVGGEPKSESEEAALADGGARLLEAVAVADVRRADPKARRSRKVGSLEGLQSSLLSISSAGLRTPRVRGEVGEARGRSGAEILRRGREEHACVVGNGASSSRTQSSSSDDGDSERCGGGERGMVAVDEVEDEREGSAVGKSEEHIR